MRLAKYFFALGLFSSTASYGGEAPVYPALTELVVSLNRYEIWDPLLVDQGVLWIGQVKMSDGDSFKLEAYDQDGMRRLDVAVLNHSTVRLIPLPRGRVAVLGRTSYPHVFEMTIAWLEDGRIKTARSAIPGDFTYNAIFHNSIWYGIDPSENAFFAFGQNSYHQYPAVYAMPNKMLGVKNEVWIVEERSVGSGDEVLSVTNLSSGARKSVFETTRDGLYNIAKSKDDKFVVATASFEKNVFLFDSSSKAVLSTLALDDTPFGVTEAGRCFVTTNGEAKTFSVMTVKDSALSLLETWDISAAGDQLKAPKQLVYDAKNDSFFVKSAYTCPSCTVSQASVYRVKAPVESAIKSSCF